MPTVSVGASIGHGEDSGASVLQLEVLVLELGACAILQPSENRHDMYTTPAASAAPCRCARLETQHRAVTLWQWLKQVAWDKKESVERIQDTPPSKLVLPYRRCSLLLCRFRR